MPMIPLFFRVVVPDDPFSSNDVDQGVFVSVRFCFGTGSLPYLHLDRVPQIVRNLFMKDQPSSHHVGMLCQHKEIVNGSLLCSVVWCAMSKVVGPTGRKNEKRELGPKPNSL